MPKDSDFHVTNLEGKGNGKAKEITENGARIFTYQERNGLYDFDESEQPRWFNPYPYLHVSSYQNWQDVVKWALPLYAAPDKDDEVQALVADIQDTYPDDREKQIVAAIHFVQNNIRYLGIENGIGSHKPRPPAQIISQGYGDCKDKSLLLVSMLNELGVEAIPLGRHILERPTERPACCALQLQSCDCENDLRRKPWWIDATRTHQAAA
ncbi:transglutaminase-like domain-containing protein [Enterovibrio coralii]|uniref:transglutaminase-like domain-containing protein n=1 Tax=Enterovibrio coralii TaxID=294935 RepID=UPI000A6CB7D7|nr:transglutaminase family protein [Enterovibrio coralii]